MLKDIGWSKDSEEVKLRTIELKGKKANDEWDLEHIHFKTKNEKIMKCGPTAMKAFEYSIQGKKDWTHF